MRLCPIYYTVYRSYEYFLHVAVNIRPSLPAVFSEHLLDLLSHCLYIYQICLINVPIKRIPVTDERTSQIGFLPVCDRNRCHKSPIMKISMDDNASNSIAVNLSFCPALHNKRNDWLLGRPMEIGEVEYIAVTLKWKKYTELNCTINFHPVNASSNT